MPDKKEKRKRVGVYVCHCGNNIAGVVDVSAVREAASKNPKVSVARDYIYMCSDAGQELIKKDIREGKIDRVVCACCSTRTHEPIFRRAVESAGLNKYLYDQVNIRDQCSWVHQKEPDKATRKAAALVNGAVERASELEPLTDSESGVERAALVIGGGIAGMNAALDIAEAGHRVYLVESSPTIGGRMVQLDKTFPTNDCSACIATPKMVEVANQPDIRIMTWTEVEEVSGFVGNFTAKLRLKARYVDLAKCTGCGQCVEVCKVKKPAPDEFNEGLSKRKAIYLAHKQAVPLVPVIDKDICIKCKLCVKKCPAKAVVLDDEDRFETVKVGAIIVATGFDLFDCRRKPEYGYGRHPDVIDALQFERLMSASGPTQGHILVPSTGKEPRTITWVQCVGSRDVATNPYCSRVCCTYAVKQARLIKEKHPDWNLLVHYIDIRTFGKGYEEYYAAAREKDVLFVRGKVSSVEAAAEGLSVQAEDIDLNRMLRYRADLVVLSAGLEPRRDTRRLAGILGISTSPDGFFMEAHPKMRPVDSVREGIFLAGVCQGPKDIPDSVAQAKAAASSALQLFSKGRVVNEGAVAVVDEEACIACGLCVRLCPEGAPSIERRGDRRASRINPTICKGCGQCVAACPKCAISMCHFTDEQITGQVEGILKEGSE